MNNMLKLESLTVSNYKGKPLNHMLATEAEHHYGQMMTEETICKIECELNMLLASQQITGIYIKVEKYDDNTFTVIPIVGEKPKNEPELPPKEVKLEDWWT